VRATLIAERGSDLSDRRLERGSISALRRDPAQLQQRRQIVRLRVKNLLDQLLNFDLAVGPAVEPARRRGRQRVLVGDVAEAEMDEGEELGHGAA